MPDVMAEAMSWLQSQRETSLSRAVGYRRGATTATVLSKRDVSRYEVTNPADGNFVKLEVRDEIIGVGQLKIDGVAIQPKEGDVIIDGDYELEVASPATNIPAWDWTNPHRTSYRVHTKPIASPGTSS